MDFLVAAGSTGGTLSGTARFLKEQNPDVQAIMPDPQGSIFYDYWKTGEILSQSQRSHVEGIGKDSIPGAMDFLSWMQCPVLPTPNPSRCATRLRRRKVWLGGSAGANVWAALEMAKQQTEPKCIVAILCDSGTKYLSKYWNEDWLESNCADFNMEHFYTHHLNI